jgi:hypothetical protein
MNQPATYNEAIIPYSSVMTDELNAISAIAIAELQSNDNQVVINLPIMISENINSLIR